MDVSAIVITGVLLYVLFVRRSRWQRSPYMGIPEDWSETGRTATGLKPLAEADALGEAGDLSLTRGPTWKL